MIGGENAPSVSGDGTQQGTVVSEGSGSNRWILITIAVIVVILIAVVAMFILYVRAENKRRRRAAARRRAAQRAREAQNYYDR